MSFKTADLCDEFSDQVHVCKQAFVSYGNIQTFSGPISTVKVLEDNVLVEQALETIPQGHVLVVDGGGSRNCALLGDRLAGIALRRKLSGVIVYGCIRDTAEIATMDVGILALGSHPLRSGKEGKGTTNTSMIFGEIAWEPGHYVYVDKDGIIVSETNLLKE